MRSHSYTLFSFPLELQRGVSSARSDDTKSLKGPILDWIVPVGQSLNPPLARSIKMDRGFHHEHTGALLCPAGLDWSDIGYSLFLYICVIDSNLVGSKH